MQTCATVEIGRPLRNFWRLWLREPSGYLCRHGDGKTGHDACHRTEQSPTWPAWKCSIFTSTHQNSGYGMLWLQVEKTGQPPMMQPWPAVKCPSVVHRATPKARTQCQGAAQPFIASGVVAFGLAAGLAYRRRLRKRHWAAKSWNSAGFRCRQETHTHRYIYIYIYIPRTSPGAKISLEVETQEIFARSQNFRSIPKLLLEEVPWVNNTSHSQLYQWIDDIQTQSHNYVRWNCGNLMLCVPCFASLFTLSCFFSLGELALIHDPVQIYTRPVSKNLRCIVPGLSRQHPKTRSPIRLESKRRLSLQTLPIRSSLGSQFHRFQFRSSSSPLCKASAYSSSSCFTRWSLGLIPNPLKRSFKHSEANFT